MAQRDTVLRWIEQLGRLIARLLRTGTSGDLGLARAEVDAAIAHLLGPLAALVPALAVPSAADLLRDPDRIYALAQLLALRSALEAAEGDPHRAAESRARAVAFGEEACRRAETVPPSWREWLDAARAGTGGGAAPTARGTDAVPDAAITPPDGTPPDDAAEAAGNGRERA
jgi:hypothetical protein